MFYYKSRGSVLGKLWGGGEGEYPAREIEAKTKKELIKEAKKMLKDGSLDSGMGFEYLIGAILEIEEIETIEKDGFEYKRSEYFTETIGKMKAKQEMFLIEAFQNR